MEKQDPLRAMVDQITLRILKRLADAADAYAADQSGATDSRCGLVQPISVREGIELCNALEDAWKHIDLREKELAEKEP